MAGFDVIRVLDTNAGVCHVDPSTRKQHIRETNGYQTDVTDEEWRVMSLLACSE